MIFIAEVKTKSPYAFKSNKSWDELFKIANLIGDWISIHVEPEWEGSRELIVKAKKLTSKPIVAKGIHRTDEEVKASINAGANYVLVVGRMPKLDCYNKLIIEPNTISELENISLEHLALWNARDLKSGKLKEETFDQARKAWNGWLCQASAIKNKSDIDNRAHAVLVGEHLPAFISA